MKKPALVYLLIFVVTAVLATGFRLYPLLSHTKGNAEEKATLYLIAKIRQNIDGQVKASYPQLSDQQAKALSKKLFDDYLRHNGAQVRDHIVQLSRQISESSSEEGRRSPYLLASDAYYYLGLTQRILEEGTISQRIRHGKFFHELMLAPLGQWEPLNVHPYLGAYLYRILHTFDPSIDVMHAVSFLPLVISLLSLAAFLLLCGHCGLHPLAAAVAAGFFMLMPIHMKRSMFAWYDNDPYNVLFPLAILYLLFLSLKQADAKKLALFSALTAAAFALYAHFWHGWVFLFAVVLASLGLLLLLALLKKDPAGWRHTGLALLTLILGAGALIGVLFGFGAILKLFQEGIEALSKFFAVGLSPWPDLYLSVGELGVPQEYFISEQLGGWVFIALALIGLIYGWLHFGKSRPIIPITLTAFTLASYLITLGAQRFVLLMVAPMSVNFAFGLQALIRLSKHWGESYIAHPAARRLAAALAGCALLALVALPVNWLRTSIRTLLNPIFNATWEKALTEIREKTPTNSIITGWWPPGHFIKAVARRAVTFDGASINAAQGYWVARLFLAQEEQEALGILRMLDTGGNKAVELFNTIGLDLPTSILAVEDLIKRPRLEAMALLTDVTKNPTSSAAILERTHALPPPAYIFVYNEFVENNMLLKFVGNYNFKAIDAINKNPRALKQVPRQKSDQYIQFLWSLVGGASKYSGLLPLVSQNESSLVFAENVTIDRSSMIAHISSKKYGSGFASSVFYLKDGKIAEQKLTSGSPLAYSAALIDNDGTPAVILMDRYLANSLLMRLYFYDGAGYKFIKPFGAFRDLTGRTRIKVFEVDWEGFIKDFEIDRD